MKTSIKKLKNCKSIVGVKLPSERVKEEFQKVYEGIRRVANIAGYRVGKAPMDLIEKEYSKTAKEEVIKRLIPESYKMILEEYKLDPVTYPDITDVKLDSQGEFFYKAGIETRPNFTLKNYKGLKLKRRPVDLKEEDVDRNLKSLQEMHRENSPEKEGEEIQAGPPKIDDEFAKDLGFEDLEKLKHTIRENLKAKLKRDSDVDLEMQVINQLVEGMNFEVPESMVNIEKERLLKDANERISFIENLQKKETPDKKFELTDKDRRELEQNAQVQALRQVKAIFILDKIAQAEKIYVQEEEIEAYIGAMAGQYKKTKDEMAGILTKNHMLDEVAVNMRNKKVMEFLLKEARITG